MKTGTPARQERLGLSQEALLWDAVIRTAAEDALGRARPTALRKNGKSTRLNRPLSREERNEAAAFVLRMTPFFGKTFNDYMEDAKKQLRRRTK